MLELPKSGILTAWLNHWLAGGTNPDDVIDAVRADDDEPPLIAAGETDLPRGSGLALLFGLLTDESIDHVRLVLPTPGDVSGLPAGASGSDLAIELGQAAVAEQAGEARLLLVPDEIDYGSAAEPGRRTEWHVGRADGLRHSPLGAVTVPEATRALKECVLDVGAKLSDADHRLAEWRQESAETLRTDTDLGLPPLSSRSLQLAAMAGRMLHLIDATRDHDEIAPALAPLDSAARTALITAVG